MPFDSIYVNQIKTILKLFQMENDYLYLQGSILILKDALDSFATGNSNNAELLKELNKLAKQLK